MLISSITSQNYFNKYQSYRNNYVSFKSSSVREEEMRRKEEQRRLEEERKAEERQRAFEEAIERIRAAALETLAAIEREDQKARQKAAEDQKVINRIIAENREFEHSVNRIKIELILKAALDGDTEKINSFKKELEQDRRAYDIKINARKEAKERVTEEMKAAYRKSSSNQNAALRGNARAQAEIFWATETIRQSDQALARCAREEAYEQGDMAEFDALAAAIEEAEKIAAKVNKAKEVSASTVETPGSGNGNNKKTKNKTSNGAGAALTAGIDTAIKTAYEQLKGQNTKMTPDEAIAKAIQEKSMDIIADVQKKINQYPAVDNKISTKMAGFLIGFICSIQNKTVHDIGEYFSDENTAKELRKKLSPECQQRSVKERAQIQEFDELKDPVMMLLAANSMKRFVPKPGILNQEQQVNLLNGIKAAVKMAVKNGDMSNYDSDDIKSINDMLKMIELSKTIDFGISFKLQRLINKLNRKQLDLSFISKVNVSELEKAHMPAKIKL